MNLKHLFTLSVLILLLTAILTGCVPIELATPAPTATPTIAVDAIDRIADFLTSLEEANVLRGSVLVAQGDRILLSEDYGQADIDAGLPNTPHTKYRLGSITKQFTAMAILILQDQGWLDVQDHACDYLTDCPSDWETITIHQLLTHTSGLPNYTSLPGYGERKSNAATVNEIMDFIAAEPLDFEPGQQWAYNNSGYIVLGAVIESVSGMSYDRFLADYIFDPLDMVDSGYDHNRDDLAVGYRFHTVPADFIHMSVPYAAGALYSTVEDLYRWDRSQYSSELFSPSLLDAMFSPHSPIPDEEGWAYGYGWNVGSLKNRPAVGHGGGIDRFVSFIVRFPAEEVLIVILSNRQGVSLFPIVQRIAGHLFAAPASTMER